MKSPRRVLIDPGLDRLPEPRAQDIVSAAAYRSQFEGALADALVLRRLQAPANQLLQSRSLDEFSGLREFLDALLPRERTAQDRIANAIHLHPAMLEDLRQGAIELDDVALQPLVRLIHEAGLSLEFMLALARGDLTGPDRETPAEEVLTRIRDEWESTFGDSPGAREG